MITPESPSILPSITNKSLLDLTINYGMKIEKRPILVTELATFDEIGESGTDVVITPVLRTNISEII
ncbi:MAG: aminotransferase class IV [Bacteroidales bacterium]